MTTDSKEDLFKILENWAKSESGLIYPTSQGVKYGKFDVYDNYKKILDASDPEKARYEFVKYCAELWKWNNDGKRNSGEWNNNHAEKIVAIVLMDIMDGKEPTEIAAPIRQASDNYLATSEIEVRKDISREGILLNLDGKKLIVNSMELLTQKFFGELRLAQLDFVRLICDQGKSIGAFLEIVPLALAAKTKSPCQNVTSVYGKVACLIKDEDNVYVILTGVYRRAFDKKGYPTIERVYDPENPELGGVIYDPTNIDHGGMIKIIVIYDITRLGEGGSRDQEFRHGFGSQIPSWLVLECDRITMRHLEIPKTLTHPTTEPEKALAYKALEYSGLISAWKRHTNIIDPSKKNPETPHPPVPESYKEEIGRCQAELERRISQRLEEFLGNLANVENNSPPSSSAAAAATPSDPGDDDLPPVFSAAVTALQEGQLEILATTMRQPPPSEEVASAPAYSPPARGLSGISPAQAEEKLIALALVKSAEEASGKGAKALGGEAQPRDMDKVETPQGLTETSVAVAYSQHESKEDYLDPPNREGSTPLSGDAQGSGHTDE